MKIDTVQRGAARPSPFTARLIAPAKSSQSRAGFLHLVVAATVGSSFYVAVEPAPTDVLFIFLCIMIVLYHGATFYFRINPILALGAAAFVVANFLSLWYAVGSISINVRMGEAISFMAITLYLMFFWYVFVMLINRYGPVMTVTIKRSFIFAASAAAVIGLMAQLGLIPRELLGLDPQFGLYGTERVASTFKDPNVYAPFLVAGTILVFNDLITRQRFPLLSLALLSLLVIGIVTAFSRGALVNLFVSLVVLVILQSMIALRVQWLTRFMLIGIFGFLILIPFIWLYLSKLSLDDFFMMRLQLQQYDQRRFGTQAAAFLLFDKHPLGVGPGQARELLLQDPHNLYLRLLVETGIVGAIGFMLLLMVCLWTCMKGVIQRGVYSGMYASCLAILAGILVNSLVIDSLHWRHFFLFLAIPVGLASFERSRDRLARRMPLRPRSNLRSARSAPRSSEE